MIRADLKDLGGEQAYRLLAKCGAAVTKQQHATATPALSCICWHTHRKCHSVSEASSTVPNTRYSSPSVREHLPYCIVVCSQHSSSLPSSASLYHSLTAPNARSTAVEAHATHRLYKVWIASCSPLSLSWMSVAKHLPLPIVLQTTTKHGLTSSEVQVAL